MEVSRDGQICAIFGKGDLFGANPKRHVYWNNYETYNYRKYLTNNLQSSRSNILRT